MERTQILDLMSSLKLYGMRSAYDEVMASGITRQHEPPRIVGDLLQSEIAEKQARSIKCQMTIAKLPPAKDLDDCDVTGTPIHAGLVRELASGTFVADQRNVGLVGGTGTGKSHLAQVAFDLNPALVPRRRFGSLVGGTGRRWRRPFSTGLRRIRVPLFGSGVSGWRTPSRSGSGLAGRAAGRSGRCLGRAGARGRGRMCGTTGCRPQRSDRA